MRSSSSSRAFDDVKTRINYDILLLWLLNPGEALARIQDAVAMEPANTLKGHPIKILKFNRNES